MNKDKLKTLAGIQPLTENNSYSVLVEQILSFLRVQAQISGDTPEKTLDDFKNHVVPDLMKDLEHRMYMDKR